MPARLSWLFFHVKMTIQPFSDDRITRQKMEPRRRPAHLWNSPADDLPHLIRAFKLLQQKDSSPQLKRCTPQKFLIAQCSPRSGIDRHPTTKRDLIRLTVRKPVAHDTPKKRLFTKHYYRGGLATDSVGVPCDSAVVSPVMSSAGDSVFKEIGSFERLKWQCFPLDEKTRCVSSDVRVRCSSVFLRQHRQRLRLRCRPPTW